MADKPIVSEQKEQWRTIPINQAGSPPNPRQQSLDIPERNPEHEMGGVAQEVAVTLWMSDTLTAEI